MLRLTIRRARLSDLEPLVQLERLFPSDALSRRNFRHLLTRARADVWVAAHGAHLLGNAVVLYRRGSAGARLYSLVVDPAVRGRGIAGRLLLQAQAAARRRRCSRLQLEVRPRNRAAIRLYRRFGYTLTGRLEAFYQDGTDALRFTVALTR
jgi:[ribosomal protein S18]-alanine N-acetyltransferase